MKLSKIDTKPMTLGGSVVISFVYYPTCNKSFIRHPVEQVKLSIKNCHDLN